MLFHFERLQKRFYEAKTVLKEVSQGLALPLETQRPKLIYFSSSSRRSVSRIFTTVQARLDDCLLFLVTGCAHIPRTQPKWNPLLTLNPSFRFLLHRTQRKPGQYTTSICPLPRSEPSFSTPPKSLLDLIRDRSLGSMRESSLETCRRWSRKFRVDILFPLFVTGFEHRGRELGSNILTIVSIGSTNVSSV